MENGSEQSFGKYTIIGHLGTGGMAEVFKCRLSGIGGFDKIVVVKRILPERVEDPEFVHMFLDEARIVANLNHPNVIHVFEVGEVDGAPYIAMEYVRGPTFSSLMRTARAQNKVHFGHAVKILSGVSAGLYYAHNAKDANGVSLDIIHRDVSPQNIIVSTEGLPKLLDFGVARAEGRLSKTQSGMFKGKLRYTAPETLRGEPTDFRSDIYAMGVCLFEATTGLQRFRSMSEPEMLAQALKGEVPRPSSIIPGYPAELERIVMWTLEPNPDDRCPTARQLHLALEQFCASEEYASSQAQVAKWIAELFPSKGGDPFGQSYGLTPSVKSAALPRSKVTPTGARSLSDSAAPTAVQPTPGPSAAPPPAVAPAVALDGGLIPATSAYVPVIAQPEDPARRQTHRAFYGIVAAAALLLGTGAYLALRPAPQPVPVQVAQPQPPKPPPGPTPDETVATYLDEAERLAKERHFEPALALLAKAREVPAKDPKLVIRLERQLDAAQRDALVVKAQAALQTKELDTAVTAAKQVLERDPDNLDAMRVIVDARQQAEATADKSTTRHGRQGQLNITSEPPALVYLDGEPLGLSPVNQRTPEGDHHLKVRLSGYLPQERDLHVNSGRTTTVELQLEPSASAAPVRADGTNVASAKTDGAKDAAPASAHEPKANGSAESAHAPDAPAKSPGTPKPNTIKL